jgi:uncharacterized membrane protein
MGNPNGSWYRVGSSQCGLLLGAAGAAVAFMLIFLGFFKTLLVCALFALGYWMGSHTEKIGKIKSAINKLFPPRGE